MKYNHNTAISVLIITLNEENQIQTLLEDLDFADEIIVVDSFSTDNTAAICNSFQKVSFIQHAFENYAAQRNFAISQAKNDWILFLDADERLTPALKKEIITTIEHNVIIAAFLFKRTFMFKDQVLHFSGNQTDKIFRLFNKNNATYKTDKLVHEKLQVNGQVGVLKNKLIHYSYSSFEDYRTKTIRYGKLKAQEKFIKNEKPHLLFRFLHPTYNFLFNYLARLGFLDGKKGFIICYLNANSVYARYAELELHWKQKQLSPKE